MGQPFDAVLPYAAEADDALSPQCIRTFDDAASPNQHLPLLANLRLEIRERAGAGEIAIRTRSIVNEPAVRLRLTVDCGSKTVLTREFVVLLDTVSPNAPTVPAAPLAQTAAVENKKPPRQLAPVAQRPAPTRDAGAAGRTANAMPSLRMPGPADGDAGRAPSGPRKASRGTSGFRLTLSRPGAHNDADLPLILNLKRSDELLSLAAPAPANGEREQLRAEARIRLGENPVAEAVQLQYRLATLESGMTGLRAQLSAIEAARRSAEERAHRAGEENRRLASLINGMAIAAAFLALALVVAFIFWRYRVAAERRAVHARNWEIEQTSALDARPIAAAPPLATGTQGADGATVDEDEYARTIVLDRRAATTSDPVRSAPPPVAAAPPARPQPEQASAAAAPALPLTESDLYLPESALVSQPATTIAKQTVGAAARPTGLETTVEAFALKVPERNHDPVDTIEYTPARQSEARARASASDIAAADFSIEASEPAIPGDPAIEAAAARAAQYLAEFERKLFPEIAFGRVSLDNPRSIIGLARTYYQEDFDPGKAVTFLEYALHRANDPMLIHLALLEILRLERRVGEYATVARAFHGQYPDSGTHWQLVAAYGRLLDPGDPTFEGDKVPGLDLDTPSNWLGSTIDMTKYVLGQKVADALRDLPAPIPAGRA